MSDPGLIADVVSTWEKRGENRPSLYFAVDRAHAKKLQMKFRDKGHTAGYVDAYTKSDERRQIREGFEKGHLKIVVNVGCLTTGIEVEQH